MIQKPKTNTDIEHQNVLNVQTKKAYKKWGPYFNILVKSFEFRFTFQTIKLKA